MTVAHKMRLLVGVVMLTQCSTWISHPNDCSLWVNGSDQFQLEGGRGYDRYDSLERVAETLAARRCAEIKLIIGKGNHEGHESVDEAKVMLTRMGIRIVSIEQAIGGIDNLLKPTGTDPSVLRQTPLLAQ